MIDTTQMNGSHMTETARKLSIEGKKMLILLALIYIGSWFINTIYREVKKPGKEKKQ